jgi:hypothetical protein
VDRGLALLALRWQVQEGNISTTAKAMNRWNTRPRTQKTRHPRHAKGPLVLCEGLAVHHKGHRGKQGVREKGVLLVTRQLDRGDGRKWLGEEDVEAGRVADDGEEVRERDEVPVRAVTTTFGEHMTPTKEPVVAG